MRIDTGFSVPYPAQRTLAQIIDNSGPSQATVTATPPASGGKPTDFGNMTRQEMRDWVNGQVKSGGMTLDESAIFMPMGMKVPVGGAPNQSLSVADDHERVNFFELTRAGIEGALSRNDPEDAKRLQDALDVMQKNQGRTIGIDMRA